MSERTREGCRFYAPFEGRAYGECRRHAPVSDGMTTPQVPSVHWCGEWRDKTVTPEQEERRELARRFAVALLTRHGDSLAPHDAWDLAIRMADAEPQGG